MAFENLTFDEKGLIPAVLVDSASNQVLMVAWMNQESLEKTLDTRLATFWSRSRGELWTKGETSGNYMHVISVKFDCDADTLLVEVVPDGPACHKGTTSCFEETLLAPDEDAQRLADDYARGQNAKAE